MTLRTPPSPPPPPTTTPPFATGDGATGESLQHPAGELQGRKAGF